ncbi:hypothetical protein FA15DRAFT_741228 [Coprinopsis marcescibilis]|uniref:Uncharacterized protein n=1 Tax=Coprinopsis marcescibilis TaxID=230819 RepID=A0A5C3KXA5_COPMA|nr:hypothetical protein FA15DRAFT_741228 [Coprinopsis marcescibilis]
MGRGIKMTQTKDTVRQKHESRQSSDTQNTGRFTRMENSILDLILYKSARRLLSATRTNSSMDAKYFKSDNEIRTKIKRDGIIGSLQNLFLSQAPNPAQDPTSTSSSSKSASSHKSKPVASKPVYNKHKPLPPTPRVDEDDNSERSLSFTLNIEETCKRASLVISHLADHEFVTDDKRRTLSVILDLLNTDGWSLPMDKEEESVNMTFNRRPDSRATTASVYSMESATSSACSEWDKSIGPLLQAFPMPVTGLPIIEEPAPATQLTRKSSLKKKAFEPSPPRSVHFSLPEKCDEEDEDKTPTAYRYPSGISGISDGDSVVISPFQVPGRPKRPSPEGVHASLKAHKPQYMAAAATMGHSRSASEGVVPTVSDMSRDVASELAASRLNRSASTGGNQTPRGPAASPNAFSQPQPKSSGNAHSRNTSLSSMTSVSSSLTRIPVPFPTAEQLAARKKNATAKGRNPNSERMKYEGAFF